MRTCSRRPSASICVRSPPAARRRRQGRASSALPRSRTILTASSSRSWPFCSHRRPTQTRRVAGDGRARGRRIELRVEAAMHDAHLRPLVGVDPAIELAATEGADRDDERGLLDLGPQVQRFGRVELFRSVHGEAVGRPAELAHEQRDLGRRWCRNGRADGRRRRRAVAGTATPPRRGRRGGTATERGDRRDMRKALRECAREADRRAHDRRQRPRAASGSAPPSST